MFSNHLPVNRFIDCVGMDISACANTRGLREEVIRYLPRLSSECDWYKVSRWTWSSLIKLGRLLWRSACLCPSSMGISHAHPTQIVLWVLKIPKEIIIFSASMLHTKPSLYPKDVLKHPLITLYIFFKIDIFLWSVLYCKCWSGFACLYALDMFLYIDVYAWKLYMFIFIHAYVF